jgi:hypothetical protein
MKKFLLLLAIITGFAACKSNFDPIEKTGAVQLLPSVADYNNNANTDTSSAEAEPVVTPKVDKQPAKIIYVTRERVIEKTKTPVIQDPVPTVPNVSPENTETGNTGVTTTQQNTGEINTGETGTVTPQAEKKKGWSNAAKGAVIGAGAGAIGGAIISKKKGLGAVIGGVVGAAGGYIIGKNIDKKNASK